MKYSIGDIILLKRTGEEGRVVSYVNNEMIEVEVGGTHFPVFMDEVDHPYLKWFTEKRKKVAPVVKLAEHIPVEQQKSIGAHLATGFHLSFLPVFRFGEFEDVVDKLKAYFINQTPYRLLLQYECFNHSGSLFRHKADLQPFSHFYLHDIPFDEMHEQPRFSWVVQQTGTAGRAACMSDTLRIKPKKLFEYISSIQQENQPMFHIRLASDFPEHTEEPKIVVEKTLKESIAALVQEQKQRKEKPVYEIDLHIEKLVHSVNGLSNFDMLSIQLDAFEDALYKAIELHQQSLVVIHGVGKGKLKDEIHSLLKSVPEINFFQHEWSPRYGYGATEIFFR
jgi:hypothetical protein